MNQITRKTLQALGKNWGKPKFNTKPMETKVRHDIESYTGEEKEYKGICCAICGKVNFDKDNKENPSNLPYICDECIPSLYPKDY